MSIQLKTDEMLETILAIDPANGAAFQQRLEALATEMATYIGSHFDCVAGDATFQGVDFAGTCAAFNPKHAGQEMPEPFGHYDDSDEWQQALDDMEGSAS